MPRNSELLLAVESARLPELVFCGPHRGVRTAINASATISYNR